ncbi:hypothetical protein MRB53_016673 [Persea americana]|uniref:Uncharacterized protein n=1 Tax=Persea americana TaxID=3435 RepID=A0ACC2M308_PERAE|nr:hypothetical protein MRB53_016673 [Persea americana]
MERRSGGGGGGGVKEGAAEEGGVGVLAGEPRAAGVELGERERERAEVGFAGGSGGAVEAVGRASLSFQHLCFVSKAFGILFLAGFENICGL